MMRQGSAVVAGLVAGMLLVSVAKASAEEKPAFLEVLGQGEALMAQRNYHAAIKTLKKAERLSKGPSAKVLLNLAVCFDRVDEFEKAVRHARAAAEAAGDAVDEARAYNQLGLSLLSEAPRDPKNLSEAEAAFRKVLEVSGGRANVARYSLGGVLQRQARNQEARAAFAEYLEHLPEGGDPAVAQSVMRRMECLQYADESQPPIKVHSGVKRPRKISGPSPGYTEEDREGRVQGVVIVEAIVDRTGDVTAVKVLKPLSEGLNRSAAKSVKKWKFAPATINGCPVTVYYNLTVNFRLGGP